jgi:flagellar hook-associated protein 2
VTSSSDKVAVTAGSTAMPGSVSFTVGRLAQAHSLSFMTAAKLTDVVTTGGTKVRLDRLDGTTLDIETGDGTLAGLVKGLNASGTGVQASTVRLDDGSYRLRVTATSTGTASDFTLKNVQGNKALLGGATVTAGQNAEITLGADVLHSATNTFAGVVNGLDITLKQGVTAGTVVTVDATRDSAAMTASVKAMVDAVNGALADIDKLTAYNSTAKTSGALAGDGSVRALRNALLESVYPSAGGSLAGVGVQTDRYGKLVFDEAAFTKAYAADPAATAAAFTGVAGFATRVEKVAKDASDSVDGAITLAIKGRNAGIDRLQDSIAAWDNRLELRRATLTRQFSGLETALSRLNSQSNWLAGQIASLNPSQS